MIFNETQDFELLCAQLCSYRMIKAENKLIKSTQIEITYCTVVSAKWGWKLSFLFKWSLLRVYLSCDGGIW